MTFFPGRSSLAVKFAKEMIHRAKKENPYLWRSLSHHHPHQQRPVWSVWEVIFWLNECHAILHSGSHGRSFDADFSVLWSVRFFPSERGVGRSCVAQGPPGLLVHVFIWGWSACLHHFLESRTARNCNQCMFGTLSKLFSRDGYWHDCLIKRVRFLLGGGRLSIYSHHSAIPST